MALALPRRLGRRRRWLSEERQFRLVFGNLHLLACLAVLLSAGAIVRLRRRVNFFDRVLRGQGFISILPLPIILLALFGDLRSWLVFITCLLLLGLDDGPLEVNTVLVSKLDSLLRLPIELLLLERALVILNGLLYWL